MVQEVAVTVRRLFQLVEKVRKRVDVIAIKDGKLVHVLAIVGMMRRIVKSFPNAALGINGSTGFVRVEQSRNAGDLGLISKSLKVPHQFEMLFKVVGYSNGRVRQRDISLRLLSGLVDSTLDLTHFLQVLAEPRAVSRRQFFLKRCNLI